MTENSEHSLVEFEVGEVRFKVAGTEKFVKAQLQNFIDDLLVKVMKHSSRQNAFSEASKGQEDVSTISEVDAPAWAVKISKDSGIEVGYIKSFFRMHKDMLAPPQWTKKGKDKEDGPEIAHVLLYANKVGLDRSSLSGKKITMILRSLGVGDIGQQSKHIKAEPGIVGGKGMYEINPAGVRKAIELLKSQIPK